MIKNRGPLVKLAEQFEAAKDEEQHDLLYQAFCEIKGENAMATDWGSSHVAKRFAAMLRAGAFESAALTLMPDGWQIRHLSELDDKGGWQCQLTAPYDWSPRPIVLADWCDTPALAIGAAALMACAHQLERDT